MTTLWRLARAQVHWSWLLLPLWLGAMLGGAIYQHGPVTARSVRDLYGIFEYFLPLALPVYLAGAPAFDREEGAAETHLGYPQWPAVRLGLLALPRLAAWAATVGAGLLAVSAWYLSGQTVALLRVLWAPALALGGVALAGSALARSQIGGLLAAMCWWVFDAMGQGVFNKQYFLFRASLTTGLFTPEVQTRNIALIGGFGVTVALLLAHWRRWWTR